MDKFKVTIEFVVKAEDRHKAWQKAQAVCENHLRDLANVRAVTQPLPDPEEWIAINEPIRKDPLKQSVHYSSCGSYRIK